MKDDAMQLATPRGIRRHAIFQRGPWRVGCVVASGDVLSQVDFSAGPELCPLEAKAITQDVVLERLNRSLQYTNKKIAR